MPQVSSYTEAIATRISPLVENLIQIEPLFEELDKQQAIAVLISPRKKQLLPEEFKPMPKRNLTERVDGMMEVEVLSKLLTSLTLEQKAEVNKLPSI